MPWHWRDWLLFWMLTAAFVAFMPICLLILMARDDGRDG